jgi:hypothetical protein
VNAIKYFTLVCVVSSCIDLAAHENVHTQAHHPHAVAHRVVAKTLNHENMKKMNLFFGANPKVMVCMQKASSIAKKTLHEMEKIKDSEVSLRLDAVLKPGEFFLEMLDGEVGVFMDPLLTESFGAEHKAKSIFASMTTQKGNPMVYFRSSVTTKKTLELFCRDFIKFFSDVHSSLSPEVRVVVAEEIKRLVAQNSAK